MSIFWNYVNWSSLWNIGNIFPNMWANFVLGLKWTINKTSLDMLYLTNITGKGEERIKQLWEMVASYSGDGASAAAKTFQDKVLDAIHMVQDIPFITELITVTTVIAVGFMIIKYGYVVFKTYFLNMDDQVAAPTMDFFKRLLYALIMVLVAPTLVFNLFIFSSLGGMAAGTYLIDGGDATEEKVELMKFYALNAEYGIDFATYCKETAESTSKGEFNSSPKLKGGELLERGKFYFKDGAGNNTTDVYDQYCVHSEIRVGQYVAENFDDALPFPLKASGLVHTLNWFLNLLFGLVVIVMTALRMADLLAALLMMWYYVQAYVSEMESNAIGSFIKNITSVCLTQFFTIAFYGLYLAATNTSTTWETFFMGAAILWTTVKGSSIIREITQDSGAGAALQGASNTARRATGG